MLQHLHDHSRRLLAWIILPLITISFVFFGIQGYIANSDSSKGVATVNHETISKIIYGRVLENLRQSIPPSDANAFDSSREKALRQQALQSLITESVLYQAGQKLGLIIGHNQVEQFVVNTPAFQENGQFSANLFNRILRNQQLTAAAYADHVQRAMLISQLQQGIAASSVFLQPELQRAISLFTQKRQIDYMILPLNKFKNESNVSVQQAQQYYEQHKDQYTDAEQVSLQYLQLSMRQILSQTAVTDAEIKRYYAENQAAYRAPDKWRVATMVANYRKDDPKSVAAANAIITKAQTRLQSGEAFTDVAKALSTDTATAKVGGILPASELAKLPSEYQQVVAQLKHDGDLSPIFKTENGFVIVHRVTVDRGKVFAFDQVHDQIRQLILRDKAQQAFAAKSEQLANLTFSNPDNLNAAATALALPIQTTDFFSRQGGTAITSHRKVIDTAFSDDVLEAGNNSDPIQIDDDAIVVIRLKDRKPATAKPFAAVQQRITEQLQQTKAKESAERLIPEILRDDAHSQQMLSKYALAWQRSKEIKRNDKNIDVNILKAAFANTETASATLANGDLAVIRIKHITPGSISEMPSNEQQALHQQLSAATAQVEVEMYVKSLLQQAKIKYFKAGAEE